MIGKEQLRELIKKHSDSTCCGTIGGGSHLVDVIAAWVDEQLPTGDVATQWGIKYGDDGSIRAFGDRATAEARMSPEFGDTLVARTVVERGVGPWPVDEP